MKIIRVIDARREALGKPPIQPAVVMTVQTEDGRTWQVAALIEQSRYAIEQGKTRLLALDERDVPLPWSDTFTDGYDRVSGPIAGLTDNPDVLRLAVQNMLDARRGLPSWSPGQVAL